jgi:hypothetical protein
MISMCISMGKTMTTFIRYLHRRVKLANWMLFQLLETSLVETELYEC